MRYGPSWLAALSFLSYAGATPIADAQLLSALFPEGVPGYGKGPGVTVLSRVRPAWDPLGLRAGAAAIKAQVVTSVGYDDNIFGGPVPRSGWQIAARPSVLVSSAWSDGSLGMYFSADDVRYLDQPSQNRTDGAAFFGGTINIGRDKLTLGAGYLMRHQDRTELDALPSDRPVAFQVEDLRASYATSFGRYSVVSAVAFDRWRFDNTTILGVPVSQAGRDRTSAQGEVTLRYAWMPARELLFVTRVLNTRYDHPAAGAPSNDSNTYQVLFGADYDDNSVWRYRLLAGLQYRAPASAAYRARTTAIAEGELIWSPSGLTTLRATITRGTEDAAQTGLSSFTYDSARVSVDHEYLHNILFNASATLRYASFDQTGGQQVGLAFGVGGTWLVNRNLRFSLTYDFTDVRSSHLPAGTVSGDYNRNVFILSLRMAL